MLFVVVMYVPKGTDAAAGRDEMARVRFLYDSAIRLRELKVAPGSHTRSN